MMMDDYQTDWILEQVLRQVYELSGQDTSRRIDFSALKVSSEAFLESDGDSDSLLRDILLRLKSNGFVVIPRSGEKGGFNSFFITQKGILEGEQMCSTIENFEPATSLSQIDVFISHSSHDEKIAERLITLIRSALNISSDKIRCTSVDGFRLPAGASIDERLKQEIYQSTAFIGIISPSSLSSEYVLFELGARWGTQKPMIPLLANGAQSNHLKGPLKALNALDSRKAAQLHQFVTNLAEILGKDPDKPAAYQKCIDELVAANSTENDLSLSLLDKKPARRSEGTAKPYISGIALSDSSLITVDHLISFEYGYGVRLKVDINNFEDQISKLRLGVITSKKLSVKGNSKITVSFNEKDEANTIALPNGKHLHIYDKLMTIEPGGWQSLYTNLTYWEMWPKPDDFTIRLFSEYGFRDYSFTVEYPKEEDEDDRLLF